MNTERFNFSSVLLTGVGLILTAASLVFAAIQYSKTSDEARHLEYDRLRLQRLSDAYVNGCTSAAGMAASANNFEQFADRREQFDLYYYGQGILVEDKAVASQLVELKSFVEKLDNLDPDLVYKLKQKVIALSDICKRSLMALRSEQP